MFCYIWKVKMSDFSLVTCAGTFHLNPPWQACVHLLSLLSTIQNQINNRCVEPSPCPTFLFFNNQQLQFVTSQCSRKDLSLLRFNLNFNINM